MKTAGKISALIGALALLAFPATGLAKKGEHGKHGKHGKHANQSKAKSCAKLHTVGYQVGGTLVSMTADDPATTDTSEATVTLTVTSANSTPATRASSRTRTPIARAIRSRARPTRSPPAMPSS